MVCTGTDSLVINFDGLICLMTKLESNSLGTKLMVILFILIIWIPPLKLQDAWFDTSHRSVDNQPIFFLKNTSNKMHHSFNFFHEECEGHIFGNTHLYEAISSSIFITFLGYQIPNGYILYLIIYFLICSSVHVLHSLCRQKTKGAPFSNYWFFNLFFCSSSTLFLC